MKDLYVLMLNILVIESKFFGVSVNLSDEKSFTDYDVSFKHLTGKSNVVVSVKNNAIDCIMVNDGLEQQVLKGELLTNLMKDLFIRDNFYNIISGKTRAMSIDDHFRIDQTTQQVLHG